MFSVLLLVLPQPGVHVHEHDALLLEVLAHLVVDDLGLVLGADAGEELALGLGDAQLVEGVLDVLGDVVPRGRGLLRGPDEVVDVVVVDLGKVRRAPGGLGARDEVLVGLEAEVEHPLRLVLELGDLADELGREALGGLEGVAGLRVVEAELLLVVRIDADQRLLFGDRFRRRHGSVDLQSDHAVLDGHREGVDGDVRGQVHGLAGPQLEHRAVARALDGAGLRVDLALEQVAVVVRAAVLDGEQLAAAVEDADLEILPFDEPVLAGGQVLEGADVDHGAHSSYLRPRGSDLRV
jgi:hypothetical protein